MRRAKRSAKEVHERERKWLAAADELIRQSEQAAAAEGGSGRPCYLFYRLKSRLELHFSALYRTDEKVSGKVFKERQAYLERVGAPARARRRSSARSPAG